MNGATVKNAQHSLFSVRRVGVTGAVALMGAVEDAFCQAVGESLIKRDAALVTRGGRVSATADRPVGGGRIPIDEAAVDAASRVTASLGRRPEEWIETVLSEESARRREQFYVGTITRVRGRTFEAERFGFVNRVDAMVGIGGGRGTEQTLTLALATGRPILPVAVFGGASARVWQDHSADLVRAFALDEDAQRRWTEPPVDADAAFKLGAEMIERFLKTLARVCFVVMPFHETHSALYDFVIEPAIAGLGDVPVRLDRVGMPGDIGRQIDAAIKRADYVIVVLDGLRANVLYELGVAHGRDKPTVLLNRRGDLKSELIPFDLAMQHRLEYDEIDRELPLRLQQSIRALPR
jgi:hypothetical protein